MYYPTPEKHHETLEDLQWLRYYAKNMQTKRTNDCVRDMFERIRSNYGHISAKPTRDALELLEAGRYTDEKIDLLFEVQLDVLENYLVVMSEYRDDYSILNDGWH
jgi:hypothetical protein